MKRSKMLFFIVAAIVVIAVAFVVISNVEEDPGPTTTPGGTTSPVDATNPGGSAGPDATTAPSGDVTPTVPVTTTAPAVPTSPTGDTTPAPTDYIEPTTPYNPFETTPKETSPLETFVPDEVTAADLPPSNGVNYFNYGFVQAEVYRNGTEQLYLISFGPSVGGKHEYLYLSPEVRLADNTPLKNPNFQFVFTAPIGHVTTITDAEYGDYTRKGYSTFVRALDYALPATYESESCPGTVWFLSEDMAFEQGEMIYIYVRVYNNGELFASLRLGIVHLYGTYMLSDAVNMDHLAEHKSAYEEDRKLTEDQMAELMAMTEEYARSDEFQHNYSASNALTRDDFVIEWREAGMGPYFDCITFPTSDFLHTPRADLLDTPLIVVSIRSNAHYYQPAPLTYYYRIQQIDGEYVYELVGIDSPIFYYMRGLYSGNYPGYSDVPAGEYWTGEDDEIIE